MLVYFIDAYMLHSASKSWTDIKHQIAHFCEPAITFITAPRCILNVYYESELVQVSQYNAFEITCLKDSYNMGSVSPNVDIISRNNLTAFHAAHSFPCHIYCIASTRLAWKLSPGDTCSPFHTLNYNALNSLCETMSDAVRWRSIGQSARMKMAGERFTKDHHILTWYILLQCIPRNMHTVFALLCFVVVIHWLIFPYPSGLLHWHCGNLTIAPVPAKQPWWIWINTSCEFIMNDCITTTKQSTTKPCAYFLGYTVVSFKYWLVITQINATESQRYFALATTAVLSWHAQFFYCDHIFLIWKTSLFMKYQERVS